MEACGAEASADCGRHENGGAIGRGAHGVGVSPPQPTRASGGAS